MAAGNGATSGGPLAGLKVVELASEATAYAGKLIADMGAEVVLVEPAGGSPLRAYGPFAEDVAGPERSLWWWHYQTSKYGVTLDLDDAADAARFRALVDAADVVVEAEVPGHLEARGLGADALLAGRDRLVWVSLTGYGEDDPRSRQPITDLTILAEGGPVWSCGYDDHSIPPVRGGGGQGFHTGAHYAVMSLLTALLAREHSGQGQRIDVNIYAASNVTTEFASYGYLVAGQTVQRQTGRHATPKPSYPTQAPTVDGGWVNTGVPPRRGSEFLGLIEWLETLGIDEEFDQIGVLRLGAELDRVDLAQIDEDPLIGEIFQAGRDAVTFIASRVTAAEFFVGAQTRGMAAGAIYSPEDLLTDAHFVARGWPTPVHQRELARDVVYPGAPIRFERSPWAISRTAPAVGEHNDIVFGGDADVRFPPA